MRTFLMVFLSVVCIAGYAAEPEPQHITYCETVRHGETVWDICGRISGGREDLSYLVWQTMRENHISDPGDLQPGQEIIIRVKAVKE